jgi:hypothetical protein
MATRERAAIPRKSENRNLERVVAAINNRLPYAAQTSKYPNAMPEGIKIFEQPALPGWVYPCTLDDIREVLSLVPASEIVGLKAAGLAPSTKKDWNANGRYYGQRQTIVLYSFRKDLVIRYEPNAKEGRLRDWCHRELRFGMTLERDGARWKGVWTAENLRRFILHHVLLHELGHHVYFRDRDRFQEPPTWVVREQYAEDYAVRMRRLLGLAI